MPDPLSLIPYVVCVYGERENTIYMLKTKNDNLKKRDSMSGLSRSSTPCVGDIVRRRISDQS